MVVIVTIVPSDEKTFKIPSGFTIGAVTVTLDEHIETLFRLFKVTFPFVSVDILPNEHTV